jgi:alkylation response protein AidB-like acyl-CoA dehydrogenase
MDGMIARRHPASELARQFALTAGQYDRDAAFPFAHFVRLHEEQLLALTAPAEDGGEAASLGEVVDLVGTIGEGCPSTALILAMHLLQLKTLSRSTAWPAHLRHIVARGAAKSGELVNALRVEPALGSPARGGLPETTARRTRAGWSLSGRKIYSTGSPGLTWMVVFARTDEPTPRVGQFLVPAHSRGVTIIETWDHLGLRASGSHDVVFDQVELPDDHAVDLRAPEAWMRGDPEQAAWNNLTIAALYTGVARAARDWLVKFLNERTPTNLGAPLASLPRMQEAMGGIEALLLTNRRLIVSAAHEYDLCGTLPASEAGLIKTVAAENAIRAVEEAVALTGNHALTRSNPIERHLRDVLCARIHTPQADSAKILAGKFALTNYVQPAKAGVQIA